MDWELYERQRATFVFIGVAVISFLLLAFQRSSVVQHVKAFFVSCTFPTQRLFSQWTTDSVAEQVIAPVPAVPAPVAQTPAPAPPPAAELPAPSVEPAELHAEQFRALKVLGEENLRLGNLLELKRERWPRLIASRVVSRDPQRWFQEALLDKGREEDVQVDDPVIAISDKREALVGRIVEVGAHTSRVMLIHDSLSSIPATLVGADKEDGVVEGSNSHDLYLKYLIRDSRVKIGDLVTTSGLGGMFPPGIPIGWVQEVSLDQRQLFVQAKLRPAMVTFPLRLVGVLVTKQ